jgi:hypothetical protein
MVREEVLRANLKEGLTSRVPTQVMTTGAPVLVEDVDADMIPCVNSCRANEVEPQPEDASSAAILILGSLRGSGFRLPRGTASDNVMSVPRSFDIVDLGAGQLGLSGYPRALPL